MRARLMILIVAVLAVDLAHAVAAEVLDFATYRTQVEPLFLQKRAGHTWALRVGDWPALTWRGEQLAACRWLLDIKTGNDVYRESALQTCAYSRAEICLLDGGVRSVKSLGIERCGVVHVRADGWDLRPLDVGDDTWAHFLHLVWLHYHEAASKTWVGEAVDPPLPLTSAAAR